MIRAGCYSAKKVLTGQGRRPKGWNKYGVKKVYLDGYTFDSPSEAKRYILLKHRQNSGEISGLAIHPQFTLTVNGVVVGRYTADFSYFEKGQYTVDEKKGFRARDWPLRSRVFMALHPDVKLIVNGVPAKKPKPPKISGAKRRPPDSPLQHARRCA